MIIILIVLVSTANSFSTYTNFSQTGNAMSVNFSPNGLVLATCFDTQNQNIYSYTTFEVVHTFNAGANCRSVRFSPNSNYIAYGLRDTDVLIKNSSYDLIKTITTQFTAYINEIDFSSDSSKLLVCGKTSANRGY